MDMVIVWTIVAGVAVIILYCILGIIPLFIDFLKWLFRSPKKATSSTSKDTEDEEEDDIDSDSSEDKGEENSAVIDEEDCD